mgnify:CR=1 FL=1
MLDKGNPIKHIADLETLLFYYQHDKIRKCLEARNQDTSHYLRLLQVELGKNIDRLALKCKFSNFLKLLIGIQKISDLTKFHPTIVSKIFRFSKEALEKEKAKVGM